MCSALIHNADSHRGIVGLACSTVSIAWAVFAATRAFTALLNITDLQWLIGYPVALFYTTFALLTIF